MDRRSSPCSYPNARNPSPDARANKPAVARVRAVGGGPLPYLASALVALGALWGGALWATSDAHREADPLASATAAVTVRGAAAPSPLDDALLLCATPHTEDLSQTLGAHFRTENPRVRLRLSVRTPSEAFADLGRGRVQAIIVPRVMNPAEARLFAAKGYSLTQFPLRLDPYVGPGRPHPGRLPRTAYLYASDDTVRGRAAVHAFTLYARRNSVTFASRSSGRAPLTTLRSDTSGSVVLAFGPAIKP